MNVALRPALDILSLCTGGAGLDLGVQWGAISPCSHDG